MKKLKLINRYFKNLSKPKKLYLGWLHSYINYIAYFIFFISITFITMVPLGVAFENKVELKGITIFQLYKLIYYFLFFIIIYNHALFVQIQSNFYTILKFHAKSAHKAFEKAFSFNFLGTSIWYLIISYILIPIFALIYLDDNIFINIVIAYLIMTLLMLFYTIVQTMINLTLSEVTKFKNIVNLLCYAPILILFYSKNKETIIFNDLINMILILLTIIIGFYLIGIYVLKRQMK